MKKTNADNRNVDVRINWDAIYLGIGIIVVLMVLVNLATGGDKGLSVMLLAAVIMEWTMKSPATLFWKKMIGAACLLASTIGCVFSAIGLINREEGGFIVLLVLLWLLVCCETWLLLSREIRKQRNAEKKARRRKRR